MKLTPKYLISIQASLFVVFLLITFFFNRFAVDDYFFIGELKISSFEKIYLHLYQEWHGRWTSNFLMIFFLKISKTPLFLMLYNLLSVGLLYFGIFRLSKSISNYYSLGLKKNQLLIYSLIFISVFFFCTVSANDTWIWYTSSIVYLWSTTAFFWGVSVFFKKQQSILDYLLLGVSAVYIGGSNEPLAFFIFLSLVFLLFKKKSITNSGVVALILGTSFLFNFLSPGTIHRDEITPNLNFVDLILYTGYSIVKFSFFSIYKTFIPALFLALPFYLLGKKIVKNILQDFNPVKELVKNLILIIIVISINQLIVVYALGALSPDRSGITSSIIIAIVMVRYLFLLGNYHQEKFNGLKKVLILNIFFLMAFNVYYANIHYRYAEAVDNRIEYIRQNDGQLIEVKALPTSGYIYTSEITDDPSNFKNQHLKNGLGIENDIVLSTDR